MMLLFRQSYRGLKACTWLTLWSLLISLVFSCTSLTLPSILPFSKQWFIHRIKVLAPLECVYSVRSPTRAEMLINCHHASWCKRIVKYFWAKKKERKTKEWKIGQIVKQFRREKMMQFLIRKGVCKLCHHRPPYLGWDQLWDGTSVTMTVWGRRARSGSEGRYPSWQGEHPGSSSNVLSQLKNLCMSPISYFIPWFLSLTSDVKGLCIKSYKDHLWGETKPKDSLFTSLKCWFEDRQVILQQRLVASSW